MTRELDRAVGILADCQKTQTELLTKMSANIEGVRVEVKDNTEEIKKFRTGGMKIMMILLIALLAVTLPVQALESIRMIFGGGI